MAVTRTIEDVKERMTAIENAVERMMSLLNEMDKDAVFFPNAWGGGCLPVVVCAPMAYYVGCEPPTLTPNVVCFPPAVSDYAVKIRDFMGTMLLTKEMLVNIHRVLDTIPPGTELPPRNA